MAFHEIQFPTDISRGSSGGPERRTDIVTLRSGFEQRNAIWANSRRRYDAGLGLRSIDDLYEVLTFFEGRMGRLHGFRWKDWADYRSGYPGSIPTASDVLIGVGNGSSLNFPLIKVYTSGLQTYTRDIKKPVQGTVKVSLNGSNVVEGTNYTLNYTTGMITFITAPASGVQIRAGFEFDVPVRFDSDFISITVDAFQAGSIPSIDIVELRI